MEVFNYPAWNLIAFERGSAIPLYQQLFAQLRGLIADGRIPRGARLPPSRMLSDELAISRNTVVLAYEKLATEGYLQKRLGAGTFVEQVFPEDHLPRPPVATPEGDERPARPSIHAEALLALDVPPERIERFGLSPGIPALNEFPYEVFARLAGQHWRAHAASHTGYDYARATLPLSRQIAAYLEETRGIVCRPEQVIIFSSTVQAAAMAAHVLLNQGDRVLLEDPGHVTQLATLTACGLRVEPVPVDDDGFDIAAHDHAASPARLAIVSAVEQFPFGCTMSAARRQALLDWAAAEDGWVLEDDFNSEIRWSGAPVPPLHAGNSGRVVYTSSFNRVLAPGLRLAYLVAPQELIEAFKLAQRIFSFYAPLPDQALVAEFMRSGHLASHLRRMRAIYRERAGTLADGLRSHLGSDFIVPDVKAGLHLTIRSRRPFDDRAVSKRLLDHEMDCPPLSRYCRSALKRHGFVLGFGNNPVKRIRRYAEILARTIEELA
ncbi:PLP-dependent aminotransferase family protein [Labrys sp. KNU-23]|uniref:MocR-like pyridoxine biosynthesis transcription factor PdxR n=1 Tax=Labrys sp. KNU-23 TaxID=2789216 RepID=UPI00165B6986|nr:PLP-dependent aminotransferase family protein [Labrys sp. KNU-23]